MTSSVSTAHIQSTDNKGDLLSENSTFPIVFHPNNGRETLIDFCSQNDELIDTALSEHGAVLFREFNISSIELFDQFIEFKLKKTAMYVGGATPRTPLSKLASTSTIFPKDQEIHLHNELSYENYIPDNLIFCCLTPPISGGQTPIADVNTILELIDPNIIDEFRQKNGWKLVRNYGQCFGPSVKDGFGTDDLKIIQKDCNERDIQLEVIEGNKVKTTQIRQAIHCHPTKAHCELWLNHVAFWHSSSIPKELFQYMADSLSFDQFPYFVSFGDGTIIPDSYVNEIKLAYQKAEVVFDWQVGDVLLLDNYRVAHGRKPFDGERLIAVAMG